AAIRAAIVIDIHLCNNPTPLTRQLSAQLFLTLHTQPLTITVQTDPAIDRRRLRPHDPCNHRNPFGHPSPRLHDKECDFSKLGFSGTDTFTYKLSSVPEPATTTTSTTTTEPQVQLTAVRKAAAAPAQHCDTADVTVTVLAPQQVAQAPSTTPTTVAA